MHTRHRLLLHSWVRLVASASCSVVITLILASSPATAAQSSYRAISMPLYARAINAALDRLEDFGDDGRVVIVP